jgi:hypothetical protein
MSNSGDNHLDVVVVDMEFGCCLFRSHLSHHNSSTCLLTRHCCAFYHEIVVAGCCTYSYKVGRPTNRRRDAATPNLFELDDQLSRSGTSILYLCGGGEQSCSGRKSPILLSHPHHSIHTHTHTAVDRPCFETNQPHAHTHTHMLDTHDTLSLYIYMYISKRQPNMHAFLLHTHTYIYM